jgi:hypothetical protein
VWDRIEGEKFPSSSKREAKSMRSEKLVKKKVKIIDPDSPYFDHWGIIDFFDGDFFHVTGGSISTTFDKEITPIFDRDQFKLIRK